MCTEFILPKSTNKRISGRTLDFVKDFKWQQVAIPINTPFEAHQLITPAEKPNDPLKWQAKYGFIAIGIHQDDALSLNECSSINGTDYLAIDAINTQGFSAALLWLPGSQYPEPTDAPADSYLLASADIVAWAVSSYKLVSDLKSDLERIKCGEPISNGTKLHFWDPEQPTNTSSSSFPLHFQFHDKKGNSLVLEFEDGEISITDNSDLGVMTNEPFIGWHRTNLSNYMGVTNTTPLTREVLDFSFQSSGQGGGGLSLSASPLPSSRFIRTVFHLEYSQDWLYSATNSEAISHAAQINGNVAVLQQESGEYDKANGVKRTYTQWNVVRDHHYLTLHIRIYGSINVWKIDFKDFDLQQGALLHATLFTEHDWSD